MANLGVAIIGGLTAAFHGHVDWRVLRLLTAGSLASVLAAAWLVRVLPPMASQLVIGGFLAVMGIRTLLQLRGGTPGIADPQAATRPSASRLALAGAIAQLAAVLVGIGGPVVTVPLLLARLRAPEVVGTSMLHGAGVSGVGLVVTRNAGGSLSVEAAAVAIIVITSSIAFSSVRLTLLRMIDLRLLVGVLAIVSSILVLLAG